MILASQRPQTPCKPRDVAKLPPWSDKIHLWLNKRLVGACIAMVGLGKNYRSQVNGKVGPKGDISGDMT